MLQCDGRNDSIGEGESSALCLVVINGKTQDSPRRTRFQKEFDPGAKVFVSAIVGFELWYRFAKRLRKANGRIGRTLAEPCKPDILVRKQKRKDGR